MAETNRTARLSSRPTGMLQRDNFEIASEELPEPGDGEFRVRISHISLDPAMRGWVNDAKSYVPPVGIGEVMRAIAVGTVEASRNSKFADGDTVTGLFGVQEYAVSDGSGVIKVDTSKAPPERWIGGLGMPGMTAYFGLTEIAVPNEGETVVVSAASGAVGSIVGQIARIKGCRAVGIAGGAEKCAYVTDELGFDACVDYKADDLRGQLSAACPDGIDVLFENVGGEIHDTCLSLMNFRGRVAICGMISAYNATEPVPGPYNYRSILVNRLNVRGFIVFDFISQYPQAAKQLGEWHGAGKLKIREDVREGGIDAFPDVLNLLYTSGNFGKLVLKV
ncbi:NADP-dependent oxidoreductase [Tepidamorphus sp. 3E244]|uniref:NADP-dependent oxidoreductase n=1 Tax=Tepidamorphus sp. 3E244 TaxID=3385498 RepID=UPI0038FC0E04